MTTLFSLSNVSLDRQRKTPARCGRPTVMKGNWFALGRQTVMKGNWFAWCPNVTKDKWFGAINKKGNARLNIHLPLFDLDAYSDWGCPFRRAAQSNSAHASPGLIKKEKSFPLPPLSCTRSVTRPFVSASLQKRPLARGYESLPPCTRERKPAPLDAGTEAPVGNGRALTIAPLA
jgi:hypothetical protein